MKTAAKLKEAKAHYKSGERYRVAHADASRYYAYSVQHANICQLALETKYN